MRAISDDVAWSSDGTMLATTSPDFKIDLWDTATGTRRAILEGLTNAGLKASFHPAGTLLASDGWEGRLRLWDPILGRPLLNLTSDFGPDFSRDGRIVVSNEDKLAICEVDPALEYRTLIPASRELTDYEDAVVRHDGRLLAVGTNRGAVLWDLDRGTEIAFLSIGNSWHLMFDPSGDLITSGGMGVRRWPIQVDAGRGELRVGPPRQLPLPGGNCWIAADRSGRIVAKAYYTEVHVAVADGTTRVLPANDCRYVAVSPDGRWLATGTHPPARGARVWSIPDLTRVAELPLDDSTWVVFSPDGKWLMTGVAPCRLWEVGTWREARRIGDRAGCFSPDGRLMAVQGASKLIRLVETESGRTLARLESPDLSIIRQAFSIDGSRLIVTTNDGPAVHVWDLRAIRERLATMGLDWDAPAYPDVDPAAPSAPRFTRVRIDDPGHLSAEVTALMQEGRWDEAAADYARFLASGDQQAPSAWLENAVIHLALGREDVYRSTCRHMLDMFRKTHQTSWLEYAAHAWILAPAGPVEQAQALELAEQRASAIGSPWCEHVLGLALYRNGRFAEAETLLMDSLHRNPNWECQILDWLVLSMAKQRLGQAEEAWRWLDRAERWIVNRLKGRPGRFDRAIPENWIWRNGIFMHLLLREARALIGADLPMLPGDVFTPAP
jgi:WD40 repeat protein